ncbi:MAG: Ig-like domain-containing protein [Gaiellaceae bacterium]
MSRALRFKVGPGARLVLSGLVALALSLLAGAAGAAPGDDYDAAISPTDVQPNATSTYTIRFTNGSSNGTTANNAHVDVPAAFTIDPSAPSQPLVATTAAAGGCSAATWTATLDTSSTPIAIHAIAPPAPTDELCPNASLLISFTATAPATEQAPPWTTTLAHDTTNFTLPGAQPVVTVDGTPPPPPTISSTPPALTNSTSASFSFAESEATATLQCALDGAFGACATATSHSYSGVADGVHSFVVRASDRAGNASTSTPYPWTVDTVPPPAPTFSSAPPNVTASTSATFDFTDGDPTVSYSCMLDGAAAPSCTGHDIFVGLSAGPHSFAVQAHDPAGNVSSIQPWDWTIDLTNPLVTIDPATEPADPTNTTSGSFAFMSSNGGITFDCALDGAAFGSCTSPVPFGPLADGTHTFAVRTTNQAHTTGPATIWSWTVDTLAPAAPAVDSGPGARTKVRSATFVFHGGELNLTYSCRLGGGTPVVCTSPVSYANLGDGLHTFAVGSTDAAGNSAPAVQRQWTVDTRPPRTTIKAAPPAVSKTRSATFAFAGSEAANFVCSLDGAGFAPCSSPRAYGGLQNGTHTFRVRATDLAGNVEAAPLAYTWQVLLPDRTPPGKVRKLKKKVGYGFLRLSWLLPPDTDLAHVNVRRRTSRTGPETTVYDRRGRRYVDRRFANDSSFVYRVRSYDGSGNGSKAATVSVTPAELLLVPRNRSVVHGSTRFVWVAAPKATYYNIQLYRGEQKLLSAWPRKPRFAVAKRWTYQGLRFRLTKGSYRWYVWPGFGSRSRAAYGNLLGTGTFVVR